MIPNPSKALVDLAMKLSTGVLPEIGSPYAAANAGMTAVLLIMLSQDSERAIANRMRRPNRSFRLVMRSKSSRPSFAT